MKFRIMNIFPLNDETSEEDFEKLLKEEYIPLWSTIPSLLKIEILKPNQISPTNPWNSDKMFIVIEYWKSEEAFQEFTRQIGEDEKYAEGLKAGYAVLQKWAECTAPKERLYIASVVTHETE
jgi:heme-degrading monooxygenase HmoA